MQRQFTAELGSNSDLTRVQSCTTLVQRALSLDFLGSRKPVHEGIKKWYPGKSHYFIIIGQFFVKAVAVGMLPTATSTSDKLFSCINIDDFERP